MHELAFTMLHTLRPLTLVDVAIAIVEGSEAVTQVVLPLAFVSGAVPHGGGAFSMALVFVIVVARIIQNLPLNSLITLLVIVVLGAGRVLHLVVTKTVIEVCLSRLDRLRS